MNRLWETPSNNIDNLPSNDNGFELFVTFTDSFDDCTLNIRLLLKNHGLGCF